MAYINFIKASWPIICLHSYLYFSLITVQIQWLLCLNHSHKFLLNKKSNFPYFNFFPYLLQNWDICMCLLSFLYFDKTTLLTSLQFKASTKATSHMGQQRSLPVSVFPLKHTVCVLFCVLIIKEMLDAELIHCSRAERTLGRLRCAKNVQLIRV